MRAIKKYVEAIEEEIEGAKDYAEKYVEAKAKGDIGRANRYKEMAGDESTPCTSTNGRLLMWRCCQKSTHHLPR